MSKLEKHVTPFVATKWRLLGLVLLDTKHEIELDDIEGINEKECCRNMFSKWLSTDELVNWDRLIKALRIVQLDNVASDIENSLLKS